MKDSGEAIEKVLAGLRDVDVPVGMERRILDGLEERTAQTRVRSRWFGFDWRGVPLSYAACGVALGVVALALAVPAIRRFGHVPALTKIDVAPAKTMPAASSAVAAVVPEDALHGRRMEAARRGTGSVRVGGSVADSAGDSEDSVAMSEMRAASFPAPPMPLTEQERLFLRMTRRGEAVELAVLDPHLRELEEREEKAEFQRLFAKPVLAVTAGEQSLPGQPLPGQPGESATPQTAGEQATPEPVSPEQTPPDVETPKQASPDSLGVTQSAPSETITKTQQTTVDAR